MPQDPCVPDPEPVPCDHEWSIQTDVNNIPFLVECGLCSDAYSIGGLA